MTRQSHAFVSTASIVALAAAMASPAAAQTTGAAQDGAPTTAPASPATAPDSTAPASAGVRSADPTGYPASNDIIVTAQRRSESLQRVPIAVSAFSNEALEQQRIDGGYDLQRVVPNLSVSRAGFGANNFQIRGIGYQIVSTTGEAGVSFHVNNAPIAVNRLSDAEFYDIERVEVLRGPQGTLYGRNATGGVINVLTAQPKFDKVAGSLNAEYGSYDTRKLKGFINVPLGDVVAVRVAGSYLKRDGFQRNTVSGERTDGRDLYSLRGTVAIRPSDDFRMTLMYERFHEDSDRTGGLKQLCIKDRGPTSVGGVPTTALQQQLLSRGCGLGSVFDANANGAVNSSATLPGTLLLLSGVLPGDVYPQGTTGGLRDVQFRRRPQYEATNDLVQLNVEGDLTPTLQLSSLFSYANDRVFSRIGDSVASVVPFNTTPFTPGGVFTDPQLGASRFFQGERIDDLSTKQLSEEIRLQSSFAGPVNFSLGGIYLNSKRLNDVYFPSNGNTLYAVIQNTINAANPAAQIGIDPNAVPTGIGHNYFLSRNPYVLDSLAAFGEVYVQITPDIRLTGGARYTSDNKKFDVLSTQLLSPGSGFPARLRQQATFNKLTWRATADWQVTQSSLLYASYSRGYKSGGFNPPDIIATTPTYAPEVVDAFEIGTKNRFFGNALTLNASAFHYDYKGYQISQINALTSSTTNTDAKIWGAELETVVEPVRNLRFNGTVGYLHTKITGGSTVDPFDRTQGNAALTLLKTPQTACVGATAGVAALVRATQLGIPGLGPQALIGACPTATDGDGLFAGAGNPLAALGISVPTSAGVPVDLDGKELPNSPHWTFGGGAEYGIEFSAGNRLTLRGDYYRTTRSFARFFNSPSDRLRGYENVNVTLTFDSEPLGLQVQGFAKNLTNRDVITGFSVQSDAVGLTREAFINDPRVYGVSVTKRF